MPYISKSAATRNAGAIFLLSLLMVGCSFDPTKDVTSADQPPDQKSDDGTMWTAELKANSTDRWFFVPVAVAEARGWRPSPTGFQIDQLVNGKIYRSTKDADGNYFYAGLVDPGIDGSPDLLGWIVLIGAFAIAMVCWVVSLQVQLDGEKANVVEGHESLTASKKQAEKRHAELEKERDEARKRQAASEKALAIERLVWEGQRIALATDREQLEQQRKSLAIVARAVNMKPALPTEKDWQRMSAAVRAEMLRGGGYSDELCVHFVFDPNHSGALLFEWQVLLNCSRAPTVVICRDDEEISRQSGQFKGKYPTRILDFTNGHEFVFRVIDGKREYPNPLLLEIMAPPMTAWLANRRLAPLTSRCNAATKSLRVA